MLSNEELGRVEGENHAQKKHSVGDMIKQNQFISLMHCHFASYQRISSVKLQRLASWICGKLLVQMHTSI